MFVCTAFLDRAHITCTYPTFSARGRALQSCSTGGSLASRLCSTSSPKKLKEFFGASARRTTHVQTCSSCKGFQQLLLSAAGYTPRLYLLYCPCLVLIRYLCTLFCSAAIRKNPNKLFLLTDHLCHFYYVLALKKTDKPRQET